MINQHLKACVISAITIIGAALQAQDSEHPYVATLLAEASPISYYQAGMLYRNGQVVEQDIAKGIQYLMRASEMGGVEASEELGKMYHYGYYVDTDIQEAKEFYELGRAQGGHAACVSLADIAANIHGENPNPDYALAASLYREAIAKGSAMAHIGLGNLYKDGRGLEKNALEAEKEYLLAIEKGEKSGHMHIFAMIDWGQLKGRNMQEAFYHLEKAAEGKVTIAENCLGKLKINGEWARYNSNTKISYPRDIQGGFTLLNSAISKRSATACLFAAEVYAKGEVVEKDVERAAKFVEAAIKNTPAENTEARGRIESFIDEKLAPSNLDRGRAATLKTLLQKDNE